MSERKLVCLRCGTEMNFIKSEDIQLGRVGFFGNRSQHLAGAMSIDFFACPHCGKLEMFSASPLRTADDEEEEEDADIPQRLCPNCGMSHDFDAPRCPNCGYDYYKDYEK